MATPTRTAAKLVAAEMAVQLAKTGWMPGTLPHCRGARGTWRSGAWNHSEAELGPAPLASSILDRVRALAQLVSATWTRERGLRRTAVPTSGDMDTKGREDSQGNVLMIAGITIGDRGHAELEGDAITVLHIMGRAMSAVGSTMAASITVTAVDWPLRAATLLNARVATARDPRGGMEVRNLLGT